uniref:Uncharacterized protein n=1 Tax=Chromera velia CCMP2878 TaxID=1169474 RepID=A0A0G4H9V1_9ALVE|eukprot:Cvel_25391.t1-p1 / transcript=Cvel_25391.t1 / gene=Cvel_25391 / organism=Chromera_velia_CCMP2878 / gene_product=hypothetical protein / transcript_product=hypothetical protein / location=Cvel_scaffold2870:21055-22569(-) / protein_length=505 / sequence_SO=supercontig / SO=protein_coding / is_pseudo=false
MIDPSRFLREISIGDDDQEPKCARPETRGMHKKASEWFWKSPDGVSVRLLEETEEGDIPVRGAETEREREREETNLRTPAHISSMLASPNPSVDIPSVPTNFHAGKKDIHPIPLKVSLQALAQIASERETRQRLTRPSDPHQLPPSPQVAPVNSNVAASPETRHDHRTEASAGPRSYRRNVRVSPPFRHEPPHHSHAPPQHERRAQSAKAPASDQSHSPLATSDFLDAVMARLKLTESSVQHLLNSSLQSHRDAQQFPPRSHLPATQTPALSYQNQRLGRGDRPSDSPCRSTASHSHSSSSSGGPGRDGFIEAGDERRSRPTEETPTSTSTRATNIRRAARRAVFAEERAVRGEKERGETERERDRDSLQTPSGPPRWSRGLVEATNLSDLISPVPSQVSPAVSGAHAEHPATVSVQGREGGRSRTGGRPREARAAVPRTRLNDAYNGGGLQSQHIQLQRDQNKGGDERSKQRGGQGGPAARGKLGENESRKSSKDICPVRPSLC